MNDKYNDLVSDVLSEEAIETRIQERFSILDTLAEASIDGTIRSLIVSGPPGVGKSYTIEQRLNTYDPDMAICKIIKGFVRATGLFKLFYAHRMPGQVIVFDDSDSVFSDEVSLNLLKCVCDSTKNRRVSWLTESIFNDDETGEVIPKTFDFNGTIIFITNLDFDVLVERGHKLAPHLEALMSRSHYIHLGMRTRQDYLIRIRHAIGEGLLNDILNIEELTDVALFIEMNCDRLRELSLRMAIKIADLRKSSPHDWARIAQVTCCKNQ